MRILELVMPPVALPAISLPPAIQPQSIQPGGGWCMSRFRAGYVRRMAEKRQGQCPNCPHDIIDPRDLKYWRNVCGFWFRPEDDPFAWRNRLGFARPGLAEMCIL